MAWPVVLAHVYSTSDSYASANDRLSIVLPWSYAPTAVIQLRLGAAPLELLRARLYLLAIDPLRGGSITDWLMKDELKPQVRLSRRTIAGRWYTTLSVALPAVSRLRVEGLDRMLAYEPLLRGRLAGRFANVRERLGATRRARGVLTARRRQMGKAA